MTAARDFGAALAVLSASVSYLLWSMSYPPDLGAIPALAAWLATALSLLDLVAQTRTRAGESVRRAIGQASAPAKADVPVPKARREAIAIAWPIAYVAALIAFGILPMTPVYVFLYMRLHGKRSVRSSAAAAVLVTLVIWVTFVLLFRYPLYPGMLFAGAG